MIRRLFEADRARVMELAGRDPAINLFIIGDVENFGFDQDFMELWGECESPDGPLTAVMLRFYNSYLPYADGAFDAEGFAGLIRSNPKAEMISGAAGVVNAFDDKVTTREVKEMLFAELREINEHLIQATAAPGNIRTATVHDVEAICTLTDQIQEFLSSTEDSRKSLHKTLESGTGRTYFIEQDGRVVASASATAENSLSAMLVAVATHPDYRGQGLATRVVAKLCTDLLAEGKSLCLFYNNPQAGLIYKKLGFSDIGTWMMMYMKKQ
ncbi:putative acetyltransferase [compost metagenome]